MNRKAWIASGTALACALGAGAALYLRPRDFRDDKSAVQMNDLLAAADSRVGARVAGACTLCHSVGKGEAHKIGPNLFGIVGARIASRPGYEYSGAMQDLSNLRWTTDELYDFIRDPQTYAPGTKMLFEGLLDPQDRADLIAYLMTLQ